jgi:hypothetical protein
MAEFPIVKGDGAVFGYSGSKIGFFGAAAVARGDVDELVVSVGTADGTVADVGGAFNQTTLNNNFRDIADKLNEVIDELQALGLIT